MRRSHPEELPLITSVQESSEDEYLRRRKKYAIMMGIRTLCVLFAALAYQVTPWLSLAFLVGGLVLPWPAVLIANDRPPKKRVPPPSYRPDYNTERLLTDGRTYDVPKDGEQNRTVDG